MKLVDDDDDNGDDTRVKSIKVTVMSKKRSSGCFSRKKNEKIGVRPLFAAPGVCHPP